MASISKLDTPIQGPYAKDNHEHKPETPCCQNPRTHGYPEETPIVQICLACGSWNWKDY
jgi:hypothetical protein